ncbi:P-loop containing nucleoside triphosphate hydrolase protein [Mucidula mucida]|nr:P-loop containing nucleoside triphosphate hydrolase protein [Mucidula mucida]
MGLGKTIQVIAFLSSIMRKDGVITDVDRRREYVSKLQDGEGWKKRKELPPANTKWPTCLIIAPSTVAQNWERELELWGYFEVGMYTGNAEERKQVLTDFKFGRLDILVTTFDLARIDIDLLMISRLAHRLKNVNSKITQAYHQFKCKVRFGLTGTAIQNSYDELHTILDWTNPGKLGTIKQWKGYIQKPLTVGQSANSTPEEEQKANTVALLPKKIDQVVFCPLSSEQIKAYRRIIGSAVDDPCLCGSKKPRKKCCHPYRPEDVLRYMSILIKLSNHLALILPSEKDSEEQLARNRELSRLIFPDGAPKFVEAVVKSDYCGKWDTLNSLLMKWKQDRTNKVLIFTKSVKLIEMLEFGIRQKNYGFLKLDGSTKQSDRMNIIDQFQTDPNIFIFLISTLAGGTGLNLTSANHVVIFDPAHDLQAMDRAFRFGQTRDVHVFRLLGAGSLEEMIYARQVYKQQQMAIGYNASIQTRYFEGVQGDPSKQGELFGLKNIFKLHEGTLATKRAIEKATNAEMDWALSNMSSKGRKRPISSEQKKLIEADKSVKEDSLQGLGTLLFDEALPETPSDLTDIQKTLNDIGVHYIHRNEDILVPSKIRVQQNKAMLSKPGRARQRASPSKGSGRKGKQVAPAWPSLRPHHIRKKLAAQKVAAANPPDDGMRLFKYFKALVELDFVNTLEELPAWTINVFNKESKETQDHMMELLREAMAKISDDSD